MYTLHTIVKLTRKYQCFQKTSKTSIIKMYIILYHIAFLKSLSIIHRHLRRIFFFWMKNVVLTYLVTYALTAVVSDLKATIYNLDDWHHVHFSVNAHAWFPEWKGSQLPVSCPLLRCTPVHRKQCNLYFTSVGFVFRYGPFFESACVNN